MYGNILTIFSLIFFNFIYLKIYKSSILTITLNQLIILWILVFIGIFIHEFIHIIGFLLGKVKFKELNIRVNKLGITVTCTKIIKVGLFKVVMILPLILTGLIPIILGYVIRDLSLLNIGIILSCACIGDIVGFISLFKIPNNALIKDYEGKLGCEVYTIKK